MDYGKNRERWREGPWGGEGEKGGGVWDEIALRGGP